MPVEISGKEYRFFVDTGCNSTIISDRIKSAVKEKAFTAPVQESDNSISRIVYYKSPGLKIGGTLVEQAEYIGVSDLKATDLLIGDRIDGILGSDVLSHLLIHIDYRSKRAVLASSQQAGTPPGRATSISIESDRLPYVNVKIKDQEVKFLIDTGWLSSGSLTKERFLETLALRHITLLYDSWKSVRSEGVKSQIIWGRSDQCRISSVSYDGLLLSRSFENRLGLYAIGRYPTTIDISNKTMYIDDSVSGPFFDHSDLDGLTLDPNQRMRGGRTIIYVRRGSISDNAGLIEGDVIIALDGVSTKELSDSELCRRLSVCRSNSLSVSVVRERGTRTFVLPNDADSLVQTKQQ